MVPPEISARSIPCHRSSSVISPRTSTIWNSSSSSKNTDTRFSRRLFTRVRISPASAPTDSASCNLSIRKKPKGAIGKWITKRLMATSSTPPSVPKVSRKRLTSSPAICQLNWPSRIFVNTSKNTERSSRWSWKLSRMESRKNSATSNLNQKKPLKSASVKATDRSLLEKKLR